MPLWGAGRKANKTSDRALMRKSFVVSGLARRRSLALLFAAAALLLSAPAASAGAESFTVIKKGVTESFTETACVGAADVTITYNAVFHVTVLDNGTYHLTGSNAGTITAVAGDVTYTGHFTQQVGENGNLMNYEETVAFTLHLTGTDGSQITFTEVFHFMITPTGVETSFDKPVCH
jgi:hypothetical protein